MSILSLKSNINSNIFGAKAAQLSLMKRNGFPVPQGFVISNDIFNNYQSNEKILEALMPAIQNELNRISANQYMVRSSAIGEDANDSSFAGQLDSFISENSIDAIVSNLKKCWASYNKENVKVYENMSQNKLMGMGVVIQELIEPDYAGVIFTRSYLKANTMLIEYVSGHGEQLVSGSVNPKSFQYCLDDQSIVGEYLNGIESGLNIAQDIEKFYGFACDIEWAMKDKVFYVVQSRPITTEVFSKEIYWSNTNVNENYPDAITPLLYSIARNAYYNYFKNLSKLFAVSDGNIRKLESAYTNVIGVFGCKMYYNMSSIHQILSASPFSDLLIQSFDNFVGYNDGNKAKKANISLKEKLNFIVRFLKMNRQLNKNVLTFEAMSDAFNNNVQIAIVVEDYASCFHEFIEIRMNSWYRASLADFYAMTFHGLLGKFCNEYYSSNAAGIQNKLIQAIPNIISAKPVIEMYNLIIQIRESKDVYETFKNNNALAFWNEINNHIQYKEILKAINNYLNTWGFRCSGELMLTAQNYIEQPQNFIALLKQYEKLPDSNPSKIIAEKHKEATDAKTNFIKLIWKKHGLFFPKAIIKHWQFNFILNKVQQGISARERVRLKQAHIYFGLKQTLQKVEKDFIRKGILKNIGDILFLTYTEIAEHLQASSILPDAVNEFIYLRKNNYIATSQLEYPDDFFTTNGKYTLPSEIKDKVSSSTSNSAISGLCACGGNIKGTIKVLESVMEASKLQKGDILVTRQTDPGWVVVFPLISGLIVERGGMLSHGAIVSREFGIPAIVGVHDATKKLKDGDVIILNADKGEIIICD